MDIEKFLVELRMSHQLGSFTSYVEQHWGEAVSELEEHQLQMDDVNMMVVDAKDDSEFEEVVHDVIDELEENHELENPIEELN